jgi:polysaccharide pyruvyl transferase WcaK-like protein
MKKRIKVLFTDLLYLNHNYGTQGLAFSMMEKLSSRFDAEYTFVLSQGYPEEKYSFPEKYKFNVIIAPRLFVILGKLHFSIRLLYRIVKRRSSLPKEEKRRFSILVEALKESDVVIDLSGIEFIGNFPLRKRYSDYLRITSMQWLAKKYKKLYLKYTKSYGPFPDKDMLYRFLVKRCLNRLPFIFVRGEANLNEVKKLNLYVPLYSFPEISLSLEAESRSWALNYVDKLGVDTSKSLVGLSPSAAIGRIRTKNGSSSCGDNQVKLFKEIIKFYKSNNQQVMLIPHSVVDGKDLKYCDLALSRKIYDATSDKKDVFIIEDMDLTYDQVRAIIGLLEFYITGRYHSVSSALFMAVPTVVLSWHTKYKDILSLFSEDFPIIDCRTNGVEKSLALIKESYCNRQWFDREKVLERKKEVGKEIDESINVIAGEIERNLD